MADVVRQMYNTVSKTVVVDYLLKVEKVVSDSIEKINNLKEPLSASNGEKITKKHLIFITNDLIDELKKLKKSLLKD